MLLPFFICNNEPYLSALPSMTHLSLVSSLPFSLLLPVTGDYIYFLYAGFFFLYRRSLLSCMFFFG